MKAVNVARLLRFAAIGGIAAVRIQMDEKFPGAKKRTVDDLTTFALEQFMASYQHLKSDCIALESNQLACHS
jgi:hypothetical protein